jgi:hypothetical protein
VLGEPGVGGRQVGGDDSPCTSDDGVPVLEGEERERVVQFARRKGDVVA